MRTLKADFKPLNTLLFVSELGDQVKQTYMRSMFESHRHNLHKTMFATRARKLLGRSSLKGTVF